MSEHKFKTGDVVALKSGGPKMTVRECKEDNIIICEWFADGKYFSKDFHQDSLQTPSRPSPAIIGPSRRERGY